MNEIKQEFYSLHNHTMYSNAKLLDCIIKPKDLVKKAREYGFSGVAITDHEILSSGVELLKLQDEIDKETKDFKIIFGNELYLINENDYKQPFIKYYHFILLAKDLIGYQQIKALSSRAWERSFNEKGQTRVPTFYSDIEEIIGKDKGHIIGSTSCMGGLLDCAILDKRADVINEFIPWLINIFGQENVFLEMQVSDSKEQIICNKTILSLSEFFCLDYIITTDSHYLDKEDITVHNAFLNSKEQKDRETFSFYKYTYLMTIEEMQEILLRSGLTIEQINKGLDNTIKIGNSIKKFDFRHKTIIPLIKIPEFKLLHSLKEWYEKFPFIRKYAYSENEQDRYLLYLIEQGIVKKNITITEKEANRINTELDVIYFQSEKLQQPLSGYFNLVKTIIDIIWQISLVGVSRGSAGAFYINYLIDIVQMNPLYYNIPYWRFSNKERVDAFDIDIDVQPEKTEEIINLLRQHFGEDNVLNCITFKTESLKSAILTGARGLGLNSDEAQQIASLVPSTRGKVHSLEECIQGDEEKDIEPINGFENLLRTHEKLYETVEKIENLSSNRSIHASALYIFNNSFLKQNSLMRAPNGTKITAFNMHDSDEMGALKFDLLRTDAQSKIFKCMELMLNNGVIKWQGSLRNTYNKYLHPDVLEYNDPKMWEKMANNKIPNLFQFETQIGGLCIQKVRPKNIIEMASANAIMRLQPQEGEQLPVDRFVAFKNDINLWYQEMKNWGLNEEEIKVLEKYLKHKHGVAGEQEDVMLILMDVAIGNFTLGESNNARKIIAKKKRSEIEKLKELFYKKGNKNRKEILDYTWHKIVSPQLGYSFSIPHDIAYSLIGLQEANLATQYSPLYWACACLCVNSGNYSSNSEDDYNEGDEEEDKLEEEIIETIEEGNETEENEDINVENIPKVKVKTVAPNYGKIAKAISDLQQSNVEVALPNINEAVQDFKPDIKNNRILYSLSAITTINATIAEQIIQNRPYKNLQDFCDRIPLNKLPMINLIKAGSFDELEKENRYQIMDKYLYYEVGKKIVLKDKITATNIKKAFEIKAIPEKFVMEQRFFMFKDWVKDNEYDKTEKIYKIRDVDSCDFFENYIKDNLNLQKQEWYNIDNGYNVKATAFNKYCDSVIEPLKNFFNTSEGLKHFHECELNYEVQKLKDKYCKGTLSYWEISSLRFYYHEHELSHVNKGMYGIVDYFSLPEELKPLSTRKNKQGKEYPVWDIKHIAGTVLNSDNAKHIVTLLTTTGVVDIKFYAGSYIHYNSRLTELNNKGKKKVVEESWFQKGNKLLVSGVRRENNFLPKRDYSRNYTHTICLIKEVHSDGTLELKYEREKVKKEKK